VKILDCRHLVSFPQVSCFFYVPTHLPVDKTVTVFCR